MCGEVVRWHRGYINDASGEKVFNGGWVEVEVEL